MHSVSIHEESELRGIAEHILELLTATRGRHVITLKGDLGAGKTTFTKTLARILNIGEEVTSPTFVLMKSYTLTGNEHFDMITHIDAYRIETEEELAVLGFEELLGDPRQLIVIEWPERILGLIPEDALSVSMVITAHNDRLITYGD